MTEDEGRRNGQEVDDLLEEEEEDVIFKTRMAVVNVALGYWKHALGLAGAVLVGAFLYGTWQNHVLDAQKAINADVARIERKIDKLARAEGATDMMGGFSDAAKPGLTEQAKALEGVAAGAQGPGAAYAWVLAANLYDSLELESDAARCWARAHEQAMPGTLGWTAASGHAAALAKAGQVDQAVGVVKPWVDIPEGGAVAEEAQLTVARIYLDAGRTPEGIQAMEQFLSRFPESDLITQVNADLESARAAG